MSQAESQFSHEIVIEPRTRWGMRDLRELAQYIDLLYFLVWRTVKVAYAQSVGGIAWALIQPAMQIIVFSLVFGGLLNVDPGEGVPYLLFSTVAIIPWTYMASTMTAASGSLVANSGMLAKIYFPRIIYPLVPVVANLLTFFISLILMAGVMIYFRVELTPQVVYLPLVFVLMIVAPLSMGLWLSSLAIRFRDVRIVMNYIMRMMVWLVPVTYTSEMVPAHLRQWYILNPFVGVIEGYKACLLGLPMYWDSLIASAVISTLLLVSGAIYFKRMERVIVDVI